MSRDRDWIRDIVPHFKARESVLMNKRQTIAIRIFGVAIVLVLVLGGHYNPALAVIGVLIVLGLRIKN
jgi:hypothetical protein